jgi:hypothetical protein
VGAGEPQVLTQELNQQGAGINIGGDGFPVHRHRDGRHDIPPQTGPNGLFFAPDLRAGNQNHTKLDVFRPFSILEQE